METEPGPFGFPEQSQTSSNTKMGFADMISSWLENDEIYTPTFPGDQLQYYSHIQMLEENFLQSGPSYFETDPFSTIPVQNDCDESFLLELCNFNVEPTTDSGVCNSLLPGHGISVTEEATTHLDAFVEGDDGDCFLNDGSCLTAPGESQDSFFDYVPGSSSTSPTNSCAVNPLNAGKTQNQEGEEDEEEEEEEEYEDHYSKSSALNCKNLVSERNRRKRLSKQLLALRALVPNITKMDKRSVLVDALSYLKSIHEEIAILQAERSSSTSSSSRSYNVNIQPCPETQTNPDMILQPARTSRSSSSKHKPHILEIDTEKIEDRRFVVKITCRGGGGGAGVGGDLLRVIESLGFEITYTALEHIKPSRVLTTVFIRVRKQGRMTEERLKYNITSTAMRSGLKLQNP